MFQSARRFLPVRLPSQTTQHRLSYQPALDGIRALAVATVLAFHGGMPWAKGGFLGVDAFFVLSGFLITSLLLNEWHTTGRIDLVAFWARRARRLMPALFLMMAGVGVYAVLFAEPDQLDKLRGDALATLGYVANWRPLFSGESYFDQFAVPSPLRHTWSLAIEEQWYAIWPLAVFGLLAVRRGSLRTLFVVTAVLMAASAMLMALLYVPHADPSRVYYGTDARAQSLLVGGLLAMVLSQWQATPAPFPLARQTSQRNELRSVFAHVFLQVAAVAAIAYVAWMWTTTGGDSVFLYRGGFLTLALAVATVIAAAVQPGGPVRRALSLPPLRSLGLISYGVYLWHWPLYLVLTPERVGWDGYALFALRVGVTVGVAVASYHLLEMPFRRGAFRQWRVSWGMAPAAISVLAVALVLTTRGGEPAFSLANLSSSSTVGVLASEPAPTAPPENAGATAPTRLILVGDSVALTLGPGLWWAAAGNDMQSWSRAKLGCGFLRADEQKVFGEWKRQGDACKLWPEEWPSYIDAFQPRVVVMLAGAWDMYDFRVNGVEYEFGSPEADAYVVDELNAAVDVMSSQGAKVVFLTTPYFEIRDLALDVSGDRFNPARVDALNELYREVAASRPDTVSVLDLNRLISPDGRYAETVDGVNVRANDGVHFSPEGSTYIGRWLIGEIESQVAPASVSVP